MALQGANPGQDKAAAADLHLLPRPFIADGDCRCTRKGWRPVQRLAQGRDADGGVGGAEAVALAQSAQGDGSLALKGIAAAAACPLSQQQR